MSYNQPPQNPYAQGPAQESGYGYGQANPYAEEPYELNNYGSSNNQYTANAAPPIATSSTTTTTLTKNEFLDRVQQLRNDIRNLTTDIEYIGQLHQRSLSSTSGSGGQASQELEHYVSQTQIRNTAIKDGIKGLQRDLAGTTDSSRNTKETQLQSLRTLFESELDKYRSLESEYSKRYRDQIARQYRIVNPDASEQEVQEAAYADWGDDGVFQTAANSLLGNVRARHNELQRIEQTMAELAYLFEELATRVEQQEPTIVAAEENADKTQEHLQDGNQQLKTATVSARRARKLKWWCALVVVLIILAVALGVGLGIGLANNATGGNN